FSFRKFNDDRAVKSSWIIGGVDINTREFFCFSYKTRQRNVKQNIIGRHKTRNHYSNRLLEEIFGS
ncbi:hypothetical protein H311_04839, partial [Anncaliia algerae PRA109]